MSKKVIITKTNKRFSTYVSYNVFDAEFRTNTQLTYSRAGAEYLPILNQFFIIYNINYWSKYNLYYVIKVQFFKNTCRSTQFTLERSFSVCGSGAIEPLAPLPPTQSRRRCMRKTISILSPGYIQASTKIYFIINDTCAVTADFAVFERILDGATSGGK